MQAATEHIDYKLLYEQLKEETSLKIAELTHQLHQLQKMIFGSRQERFVATDDSRENPQLALALDADTVAACKITDAKTVKYVRTKTEVTHKPTVHPGRMKLPENLRRETIILQPDTNVTGLKKIGDEITEILDLVPAELYVKQYIRPKYVLPIDESSTIITAALPERIMQKCMFGEGLLAQIAVDKFVDHLPLSRQLQRFQRAGIMLAQSTIVDATQRTLIQLTALFEAHKTQVLTCNYLHADETPIGVLDPNKKGTTHQGYYWVYHNSIKKFVLFDYQPGRGREGPGEILKNFQGYLQTDGYSVYDAYDKKAGITLMHCMAHARRKFNEALQSDELRATHALKLFQKLYVIEQRIREEGITNEAVVTLRQQEAVPLLNELEAWMTAGYPKVTPKSPIGKAIAYTLPRWKKLSLYTTQSYLKIDNNPVVNAIRPIALGRKNYLFAGRHEAAQRAAMIYSLFATCRLHNINPYQWLKDVLERMHLYNTSNIQELLPQNWKPEA
ncbi:MAG: transposase [Segetibacter sp.]|nr:transposase [Segetibacter sp.]